MLLSVFDRLCKKNIEKNTLLCERTATVGGLNPFSEHIRPKSDHLCHHQSAKFVKSRAALGPTSTWKKTWWSRVTWNVFKTYLLYAVQYSSWRTFNQHALFFQPIDMPCFFWRNEWRMNDEWMKILLDPWSHHRTIESIEALPLFQGPQYNRQLQHCLRKMLHCWKLHPSSLTWNLTINDGFQKESPFPGADFLVPWGTSGVW